MQLISSANVSTKPCVHKAFIFTINNSLATERYIVNICIWAE